MCLERVKNAGFAPLAISVNIGPDTVRYVSVLEQKPSYYSHVGRVMVANNSRKNSWHCPCAKPWTSCIHSRAKLFLFQNKCHLFNSVKSTEPLEDTTSNYLEEGKVSHDSYPLGKELLRTATYIQKFKKLPAKLPKNVLTPSFDTLRQNLYSLKCFSQNAVDKESLVTPFS